MTCENRWKTPRIVLLCCISFAWMIAASTAAERPDVLVLFTDQWNPRCLPFTGDKAVPTPNLDRLASEGMIFDACYSPCPVCIPARASLLSGLYPHNHNIFGNLAVYFIPPEITRMFQDIRAAGYTTAQVGKNHWTEGGGWRERFATLDEYHDALGLDYCQEIATPFTTPEGPGVYQDHLRKIGRLDAYCRDIARRVIQGQYEVRPSCVEPQDHNDTFVANTAISFLKKQPVDKPYCLVTSFPGPHTPLDAPGEYATLVAPDDIELPPNCVDQYKHHGKLHDRESVRRMRANYYGKMALIDDQIGRIVDMLRERGTWDNTLVIFSSDHGEMIGAHGRMSKGSFFEESVRVPLVMRWPGHIQPGGRTSALTQLFDIYPTIVQAIGGKLSPGHFAVSQLPVATGEVDAVRDAAFSEIGTTSRLRFMVRTPRWSWWVHGSKEALYDMKTDPYQMRNLINSKEHREIVEQIHARHLEYFRTTQYNLSAGYIPRLNRMKDVVGHAPEGLESRLYQMFRKNVGLD